MRIEEGELRDKILEAASELFLAGGPENLSMRKIAKKIKYTATSIYLHFKDKNDLLKNLGEEGFKALIETAETNVAKEAAPLDRLKQMIKTYVLFAMKNPNRYRMMFASDAGDGNGIEAETEGKGQLIAFIQGIIEECVNGGEFKPVNASLAAHAFWGFLHGAVMLTLSKKLEEGVDVYKLVSFVTNIFLLSLRAGSPG